MGKKKYLYAIRDTKSGKLVNAKCGKSGKYYEMGKYADNKVKTLNKQHNTDRYKKVTFEIIEVENRE